MVHDMTIALRSPSGSVHVVKIALMGPPGSIHVVKIALTAVLDPSRYTSVAKVLRSRFFLEEMIDAERTFATEVFTEMVLEIQGMILICTI